MTKSQSAIQWILDKHLDKVLSVILSFSDMMYLRLLPTHHKAAAFQIPLGMIITLAAAGFAFDKFRKRGIPLIVGVFLAVVGVGAYIWATEAYEIWPSSINERAFAVFILSISYSGIYAAFLLILVFLLRAGLEAASSRMLFQ